MGDANEVLTAANRSTMRCDMEPSSLHSSSSFSSFIPGSVIRP